MFFKETLNKKIVFTKNALKNIVKCTNHLLASYGKALSYFIFN